MDESGYSDNKKYNDRSVLIPKIIVACKIIMSEKLEDTIIGKFENIYGCDTWNQFFKAKLNRKAEINKVVRDLQIAALC